MSCHSVFNNLCLFDVNITKKNLHETLPCNSGSVSFPLDLVLTLRLLEDGFEVILPKFF